MADRSPAAGRLTAFLAALLLVLAATAAQAVQPGEMLADPALEARAREVGKELRCLVCQNQSIDDSDADLAHDLRVLVRERIVAGDSDRQVLDYVVSRYGDFVLLRPPFKPATWLLWLGPAAIVSAGLLTVVLYYRRRNRVAITEPETAPLSEADERRLARLLEDESS